MTTMLQRRVLVMPYRSCESCGSGNQREFSAEMAIHFPVLKGIDKPPVGFSPRLLSVWIAGPRNSPRRKLNCGNLRRATPLQQGDVTWNGIFASSTESNLMGMRALWVFRYR